MAVHNTDQLYAKYEAQDARIAGLEKTMGTVVEKLDAIAGAVTRQSAQPHFSISTILAVVCMCATLLGAGATSIIFISTAINAGPMARLEERQAIDRERIAALVRAIERSADQKLAGLAR